MDIFEQIAQRYDTPQRAEVARIAAEAIQSRVENPAGKTAMDFGCGTGLVGLQLASIFERLLLVDTSPKMIEQVEHKIHAGQLANAQTLCANLLQQHPLQNESFHCLFMVQVLLHIPQTEAVFAALYPLLKPGGQLIIVDFNKQPTISHPDVHNGFVQQELALLAQHSGFQKTDSATFHHGKNLFMNQDASMFLLECVK